MPDRAHAINPTLAAMHESYGLLHSENTRAKTPIGISGFDQLIGGLPQGAITEVFGPQSSGRTTILFSAIAQLSKDHLCALVDASDSFDIATAQAAKIRFDNLLWARCGSNIGNALKTTELLLRSGSFSLVALDLANLSQRDTRQLQQSHWIRFRRAIENTDIRFIVIGQKSYAQSLAGQVVETSKTAPQFITTRSGQGARRVPTFANLLQEIDYKIERRRPFTQNGRAEFTGSIDLKKRRYASANERDVKDVRRNL